MLVACNQEASQDGAADQSNPTAMREEQARSRRRWRRARRPRWHRSPGRPAWIWQRVGRVRPDEVDLSAQAPRDPSQVPVTDTAAAPSMLIRTGNAQLEVDSLEIAMQQVRDLAQRLGGYIANTQLSSGRDQIRSATMEMKLPVARWTQALEGLKPIGKVEALNEFTQDVGEEYVDVTARVQNAKRLEARLIELLANRTGRLSDVLSVERELARVREEIERYEGRLRYLRTRASMSTMSVTVHEAFPVVSARGETGVLGDAFKQAWRNFVGFIAGIISLTGILIPLAAIGVVAWLVWRRWWRRRPPRPDAPPSTVLNRRGRERWRSPNARWDSSVSSRATTRKRGSKRIATSTRPKCARQ